MSGESSVRAALAPAVAAPLSAPRQPAAASASERGSHDDAPDGAVTSPQSGGNSSLPIDGPAHAALQSALSATTRLDGGSQSAATSQLPGANAASSAAGAPGAAAQAGLTTPPSLTTPAATSVAPQATATATVPVHAEVGSTGWATELGTRLHWMTSAGLASASLRLTPEQLGPVEVRISVHQNAASVWFNAAQPDTRVALEQALPRLRELFSAEGLNLAQAGVSDQSSRGAKPQPQAPALSARSSAVRELSATSVTSLVRAHQGLIDTYA